MEIDECRSPLLITTEQHRDYLWLPVLDFLGGGYFSPVSHLRLVNRQFMLLVNESVRYLTVPQQFFTARRSMATTGTSSSNSDTTTTTTTRKAKSNKKQELAHLFHFLKQFPRVQIIRVNGFEHDIRTSHIAQLAQLYCSEMQQFEMDGHTINAFNSHEQLKQFLKSCPQYRSIVLYSLSETSGASSSTNSDDSLLQQRLQRMNMGKCAKYIAKYGKGIEKLYISSTMTSPFDWSIISQIGRAHV